MTGPEADAAPTATLRSEHRTILRVIRILEKLVQRSQSGDGFESDALQQCVNFFKLFADACHHAKEEDLLFPVLEARGIPREHGPIGVMLDEHRQARQFTAQMAEALPGASQSEAAAIDRFHQAAHHYIQLLTSHIHKEDDVLFVMGDRVMRADDQASLCRQFCEVGCRAFGGKTRQELERIADELESAWGDR